MPYGTSSSRKRHDHARRPSGNTAIASFARATEQGVGYQPQDRCEVAQACDGRGYEDGAVRAAVHRPHRSRRGDGCGDLAPAPYQVHTILTDNGIQFAEQPRNRNTIYSRPMRFDMICEANGIEHRLTKSNHPWTNDQVERMNRTIKEATVKRLHYDSHDQLRQHLRDFIDAYNFGRRLKTLKGLTPYEFICKQWTSRPARFIVEPIRQMPGLNT